MAALTVIHDVSKQALVELRSVLGILRDVDAAAPRTPSSSLARLDDLLAGARASGLSVRLEGGPQPLAASALPASVDLAAYRILQEALTNAARHSLRADGGTHAVVRISRTRSSLVLEVDDAGRPLAGAKVNGSGNGIVGMTERAQALGGTLEAGPRPEGGFRVRACLPVDEDEESA